jgi:hypothetical protein
MDCSRRDLTWSTTQHLLGESKENQEKFINRQQFVSHGAVPQLSSSPFSAAAARVRWDLWGTKCHRSSFSPNTNVLPAISHSTNYSLFINHPMSNTIYSLDTNLTNQALRHEGVWGSGCIDPYFLDLGTTWRWVVSFTLRSLYTWENSPRYPLDGRLGGPQSRSKRR